MLRAPRHLKGWGNDFVVASVRVRSANLPGTSNGQSYPPLNLSNPLLKRM